MPPKGPRGSLKGHVIAMEGIGATWTTPNDQSGEKCKVQIVLCPLPSADGRLRRARWGSSGGPAEHALNAFASLSIPFHSIAFLSVTLFYFLFLLFLSFPLLSFLCSLLHSFTVFSLHSLHCFSCIYKPACGRTCLLYTSDAADE